MTGPFYSNASRAPRVRPGDVPGSIGVRAGQAALSRAIGRLVARGLVDWMDNDRRWRGATCLSDAGIALAKSLSVKAVSQNADLTDR
jgi:hypothetical protein